MTTLLKEIKKWAKELGFDDARVSDIDLGVAETRYQDWLTRCFHGEMGFMARHGTKRSRPAELEPGTLRILSVRMNYLPDPNEDLIEKTHHPLDALISRYALGRDYHKLMRKRLQRLAKRIERQAGKFGYRVFVDSAPVLEKPIAEKAGLGWIGKHSNLINKNNGSWFFLGEIYTDLPLPVDTAAENHCGTCSDCIDICPTGAIVEPYVVDARRCISYLTIELKNAIPKEFRAAIGNRIYGCDDCQAVCPWNRFARKTAEADFLPRQGLHTATLLELFDWSEREFLGRMEGSPIRRIGYQCWQRNIAVALGNSGGDDNVIAALEAALPAASEMVAEHIAWALKRLRENRP